MADKHYKDNETHSGGAIATSEDISISKKGISGDKDNLLDSDYTLFKRRNNLSDPEAGNVTNEEGVYNHNNLSGNEGNY